MLELLTGLKLEYLHLACSEQKIADNEKQSEVLPCRDRGGVGGSILPTGRGSDGAAE